LAAAVAAPKAVLENDKAVLVDRAAAQAASVQKMAAQEL
jgi:hypothetical protein